MTKDYFTLPRLYVSEDLAIGAEISLDTKQAHYLKNVLRRREGDEIRLFNGRDGDFLANLKDLQKKSAITEVIKQLKPQDKNPTSVHLLFAPLKKNRMDMVIEKGVELGVTDFHPIITQRTEIRKLNEARIAAQIIEASEQCERMTLAKFHEAMPLHNTIESWNEKTKILWAWERESGPTLANYSQKDWAFLIGPVGGFTDEEAEFLKSHKNIEAISLGASVLRAETAGLLCLAHAQLCNDKKTS